MNAHRIIFRLDFRPNFKLYDSLGNIAHSLTENSLFKEVGINTNNKQVIAKFDDSGSIGRINVDVGNIILLIESLIGVDVNNLRDFQLLSELVSITSNICGNYNVSEIKRCGLRTVLFGNAGGVEKVSAFMRDKIDNRVIHSIEENLGLIDDYLAAYDGKNDNGINYHVTYGPYYEEQASRHLELINKEFIDKNFNYDFICDIDQYEANFSLPSELIKKWSNPLVVNISNLVYDLQNIILNNNK